ncbi:electron transfer flavoprotein subunit alpha/FixB family protein [Corallincola platygyrae]|uniref:Electron transfer flavoprotein subunit alpha/FixB family protein n=1 Tax=Corallincola platygyrae TaxID=1193278 RepID=A0ABW4XJI2_9GAMM
MSTLVIAELQSGELSDATLKAISAANQLSQQTELLLWGAQVAALADGMSTLPVAKIRIMESASLEHGLAESLAPALVTLAREYSYLLAGASTFAKDLLPRVAALLDVGMLSDVVAFEDDDVFVRPMYAGNAMARVKSHDDIRVLTVRGSAFALPEAATAAPTVEMVAADITALVSQNQLSSFVGEQVTESERPELASAKVVVSGGRGLQSAEQFGLVEQLADHLGAAVGASRAAVDAGFIGNDFQVGQTGKIVAPDLYIALGISGAIQHIAGMKDAKVVVAVNKDPEAPIFDVADYGLVGDLFDVVPQLIEKLPGK